MRDEMTHNAYNIVSPEDARRRPKGCLRVSIGLLLTGFLLTACIFSMNVKDDDQEEVATVVGVPA